MLLKRILPIASAVMLAVTLGVTLGVHAAESPVVPETPPVDLVYELLPPPQTGDGLPAAEIVDLPPVPGKTAPRKVAPPAPAAVKIAGYKTVLSGQLAVDTEISAANSPALILGALVIPTGRTLTLKPGAVLNLRADPNASAPARKGVPDPRTVGTLWVSGRLLADGLDGKRGEISVEKGQTGGLFFAGSEMSELRGLDVRRLGVTQTSGCVQWLGCEFSDTPHYALAGGAAFLVHCVLRRGGGLFAAYDAQPWALLVNRCSFEDCREGLVLRPPPGTASLFIERNAFVGTTGANLRALPEPTGKAVAKSARQELLIGENWYGTNIPEQIDARIIDRRSQKDIRVWLNTRPPAEQAYADSGAKVPIETLARTLQELEPVRLKMLKSLGSKETVQLKP